DHVRIGEVGGMGDSEEHDQCGKYVFCTAIDASAIVSWIFCRYRGTPSASTSLISAYSSWASSRPSNRSAGPGDWPAMLRRMAAIEAWAISTQNLMLRGKLRCRIRNAATRSGSMSPV